MRIITCSLVISGFLVLGIFFSSDLLARRKQPKTDPPPAEKVVTEKDLVQVELGEEWTDLFCEDLSNATLDGKWEMKDGELVAKGDHAIWTRGNYKNYVLQLEFKVGAGSNSGILLHVTDPAKWIPNSVEVQVLDDSHKRWQKTPANQKCGSIFGRLAPSKSVGKGPGEWNTCQITCKERQIDVNLNGEHVITMDMDKWDSATKNPDGSTKPKWLPKPLSTHPAIGKIGLQGLHGGAPVIYRNIKIKKCDK